MPNPVLAVPLHLQDSYDKCGLACAEMVLCCLTNVVYQQTDLAPQTPDPVWATSPRQLRDMINYRLSAGPLFECFPEDSLNAGMDRVLAALGNGYPAVVLTDGDRHWTVVHGVTEGKSKGSLTIHFQNSEPDRLDAGFQSPLPPHADGDGCPAKSLSFGGTKDGEVAACEKWASEYMLKAKHDPVKGKYVVVVPSFPIPQDGLYKCRGLPRRGPIDGTANIGEVAWNQLIETNLLSQPEWNELCNTPPAAGAAPHVRVEDLDSNAAYLLVLLENESGDRAFIQIGEDTGTFQGALLRPSDRLVSSVFAAGDAIASMKSESLSVRNTRTVRSHAESNFGAYDVMLRSTAESSSGQTARLVWRYSVNTFFSPFVPMVEVTEDDQTKYIRSFDGIEFVDLA
jgi:hypothetical protein